MTNKQREIIRNRVGLLELANQLGNESGVNYLKRAKYGLRPPGTSLVKQQKTVSMCELISVACASRLDALRTIRLRISS